ncbi:hypothetical protein DBR11_13950 [Pedobacter sp. HMWF019]|uniref:hypothetical protein n=1 Tax=Pedobacter sp. HMWF019 TaxID=2056856 RepID=UPI000D398980|nr:hypothetical protein [Pedobacter sp. HMWF019]PTS98790.1 hypothetical protein DBR11_13950 [Pedobacter sp. HMWF019]
MKDLFISFLVVLFFIAMSVWSYKSITRLEELDNYTGRVKVVGINSKPTSFSTTEMFFMKIHGLEDTIGVWHPIEYYDHLTRRISAGDLVTVYFNKLNMPDRINLKTHRIEKDGDVVYKLPELKWLVYVSAFFLILAFIVIVDALYKAVTSESLIEKFIIALSQCTLR